MLPLAPLPAVGEPLSGYLYFELDPGDKVRGRYALAARGAYYREVNLDRSLLAFRIETPEGVEEVRVGLRAQGATR